MRIVFFLLTMAIGVQALFAAVRTVAVLPSDGEGVLDESQLKFFTDKAQEIAVRVLPKSGFEVFPQNVVIRRLGGFDSYVKECKESSCIVDLGRKAKVDYVAQCSFGKLGSELTVAFELYNVSTEGLIDKFVDNAKNINGLRAIVEKRVPESFMKIPGASPEAATVPVLVPEPVVEPPPPPMPMPEPVIALPEIAPALVLEPEIAPVVGPLAAPLAVKKECEDKFNANKLVSRIRGGFAAQLKDCSATLAKNAAIAASPFGKKAKFEEPKTFMMECAIGGMRQKLDANAEGYIKPIESFVQNLLNASTSADGALDVARLSDAIGVMNLDGLLNEIKAKAANDECAVNEPYEPFAAVAYAYESEEEESGEGEDGERKIFSWGIRGGFNFSHLYATYDNGYVSASGTYKSTPGVQLGFVFDWALTDWLHIQPGIMYIHKGAEDDDGNVLDLSQFNIPLLLSLKYSALRINAGPYYGLGKDYEDIGLRTGFGFDIGRFYIGVFYDYGLSEVYDRHSSYGSYYYGSWAACNRTLGLNLGVNFL